MSAVILNGWQHLYNRPEVARQEYEAAREDVRLTGERYCTHDPDSVQKYRAAMGRRLEARRRYLEELRGGDGE